MRSRFMQIGDASMAKVKEEPAPGGWLGPLVAGACVGVPVIVGAVVASSTTAVLGLYALGGIVAMATYYVCLLIHSRRFEGAQFKIYAIPGYFLYYVYGVSESRYLQVLTPVVLGWIGVLALLMIENANNPKQPKAQPEIRVKGPVNVRPTPGKSPHEIAADRALAELEAKNNATTKPGE